MGAGGVGGYFGGRLARAGHEVVFVARGDNLEALERRGLRVYSAGGDFALPAVWATASPADAGRCDLVLVCVKSYDTPAAADALRPVVGAETVVLSLQNGIENEAILQERLELPPLMGGLTHIGAELEASGIVRHSSGGRIIVGEADGAVSARARWTERLFGAAGIDCRLSRHIAVMLWDKLSWNAAFNGLSAVTRSTVGEILRGADGRALARRAMLEVVAVARASGVPLDPERVDAAIAQSQREMPGLRTSMLQDLERGKRLEHDALNGAVVRAGARTGTATPVNHTLFAVLACLDPGSGDTRPAAPPAEITGQPEGSGARR